MVRRSEPVSTKLVYASPISPLRSGNFPTAALTARRFFADAATFDDTPLSSLRSLCSSYRGSSLIDAARLSCWGVTSVMFMVESTTPQAI